jgi:hypothetical protein
MFAIQWLGSPWQLGGTKAVIACLFFIAMIILSVLPAMFREWGNVKKRMLLFALVQIICLVLGVIFPGIGQVITFIYNIILICLPVSFYKYAGTGSIIFFLWLIGLNNILGNFMLIDPRGVWSGDLYLTMTDWVILGVFIIALARAIYHIVISYPIFKGYERLSISYILDMAKSPNRSSFSEKLASDIKQDLENIKNGIKDSTRNTLIEATNSAITDAVNNLSKSGKTSPEELKDSIKNAVVETTNALSSDIKDTVILASQDQIMQAIDYRFGNAVKLLFSNTQLSNEELKRKERKTLIPIFLISIIAIIVSTFIKPAWYQESIDDLNKGFTAVSNDDLKTAIAIAKKYYSDEKILYNGDVFFLNGLVEEKEAPQTAIQHYRNASDWYKNHKSLVSENHYGASLYRLALAYANNTNPDFYQARNAIDQAVKVEPANKEYMELQAQIKKNLTTFEKEEKIGFFKRIWNNIRSR